MAVIKTEVKRLEIDRILSPSSSSTVDSTTTRKVSTFVKDRNRDRSMDGDDSTYILDLSMRKTFDSTECVKEHMADINSSAVDEPVDIDQDTNSLSDEQCRIMVSEYFAKIDAEVKGNGRATPITLEGSEPDNQQQNYQSHFQIKLEEPGSSQQKSQPFNNNGNFAFLKYLSFVKLQQRMHILELNIEREMDEVRKKYHNKRQLIRDAMDAKRKRSGNF